MGHSAKRHGNSVAVIAAHYQQFNDEDEREAFKKTSEARRRQILPYREQRAVGGGSVQIQNADKTQGQNTPHQRKNPSIPSDIEGYMAHPRGVEPLTPGSEVQCSIQLSYGCSAHTVNTDG